LCTTNTNNVFFATASDDVIPVIEVVRACVVLDASCWCYISGAACHPLPGVAEPVHKITMGNIHSLLQDHPLHILLLFTIADIP
jgi:hypothetical protein